MEQRYYSPRLTKKLQAALRQPTIIVEAPSGYGKTSAIRDHICLSAGECAAFWLTCSPGAAQADWQCLCQELSAIDPVHGNALRDLGFPTAESAGEVAYLLRRLTCGQNMFFVLDNFHHMQNHLPPGIFTALTDHQGERLHLVIITQILPRRELSITLSPSIGFIGQEDLCFTTEDILQYFQQCGAEILPAEAQQIHRFTEGWAVAVYLQCAAYRQQGILSPPESVFHLMEILVWEQMTAQEQSFLLYLAPFAVVSLRQACFLLNEASLPSYAITLLQENPFIRMEQGAQQFVIHGMLQWLLQSRLAHCDPLLKERIWRRSGDWYAQNGSFRQAIEIYYRHRDWERLLDMPLYICLGGDIDGEPFAHCLLRIAQDSPVSVRREKPIGTLRLAGLLLLNQNTADYYRLLEESRAVFSACPAGEDTDALWGEWYLMRATGELGDLDAALESMELAKSLLPAKSQCISPKTPLLFTTPYIISLFHRRPGHLDEEMAQFSTLSNLYTTLTSGGTGAQVLAEAECDFHQLEIGRSEVACYKAAYLTENTHSDDVRIAVEVLLARIAIYKGDVFLWQKALSTLTHLCSGKTREERQTLGLPESLYSIQDLLLQRPDTLLLASLLQQQKSVGNARQNPIGLSQLLGYTTNLLQRKAFTQMLGATLPTVQSYQHSNSILPEIYCRLIITTAYCALGEKAQAISHLDRAMEIAFPDRLFMPFAEFAPHIRDLLEDRVRHYDPCLTPVILAGSEALWQGVIRLTAALFPKNNQAVSLSKREQEVAQLAAAGMRNKEIAQQLYLSESTVKAYLKTIFQKLGVDRRSALASKLGRLEDNGNQ